VTELILRLFVELLFRWWGNQLWRGWCTC